MALYERFTKGSNDNDDLFTKATSARSLSKYRIPEVEGNPQAVCQFIEDELLLDGNAKQNLATFCSTWMEDEVHRLMKDCIGKNMIDKDEYPQTAEIESRCVSIIASLWNAHDAKNAVGTSTTGSSEAAMLGGLALKWKWRKKREALGKSTDKPNLICGAVQVCWHKFARYWDVELREVPMAIGRCVLDPKEVIALCDENTIGVVCTLGITFTGEYEPVKELSDELDAFEKTSGLDIPIHTDGASGGFLAPFCNEELLWDFRLPRVKSINGSGHKFGLTPLGCGWVIWGDKEDLPDELIFKVNYLGGDMPTFAINFSRPGGQIVAQYYLLLRNGREGYKKIHGYCYEVGEFLVKGLKKFGIFEFIYASDPKKGIPAVTWKLKEGVKVPFTLYDLSNKLRERGWLLPSYSLPPNAEMVVVQRVLIRHGCSFDLIDLLLTDMDRAILELTNKDVVSKTVFNHA